ncbi:MAG: molybdopterin-dependent oxidoreductase, partial [bacterium]
MSENIITINGSDYSFTQGDTILDVARKNNIFIPTLCHLAGTTPTGACRVCVVEVEKARNLVPACSMPASNKMVVKTESPRVYKSRRFTLELLLSSGNHNCAVRGTREKAWMNLQLDTIAYDQAQDLCEVYGRCRLQEYAYKYQVNSEKFSVSVPKYEIEINNPLLIRDFSRCILCGRCVQACNERQVNNAISSGYRGDVSKIVASGDSPLASSDCVFCGECLERCPVGALVEKKNRYNTRMWNVKKVHTTCHYCGVGCRITLHTADNKVLKATGTENAGPNKGSLCVRGRFAYDFINSPNRVRTPLIREQGVLKEASWAQALDLVVRKIREIKEQHGPDSIACIASPKSTNEDIYMLQKLFRVVIGTNNINQSEQLAITGKLMGNSFEDFENAEVIVIMGADITEDNPVAAAFVKRGILKGNKLVVIDSKRNKISKHAALHLVSREGTEGLVISSIINQIFNDGKSDFKPENTAEITGISKKQLAESVKIIKDKKAILIYDSSCIQNIHMLENFKKLFGENINTIAGNNNTCGACIMGALPDYLPGYKKISIKENIEEFENLWNCKLNNKPGLTIPQIQEGIGNGQIKMLLCVGENIAIPEASDLKEVFTVSLDIFCNGNSKSADVILPIAAWSEYEGTYINSEARINKVGKAVNSPEKAKPVWWIIKEAANRLGTNWDVQDPGTIWNKEIAAILPGAEKIKLATADNKSVFLSADVSGPEEPLFIRGWGSQKYHTKLLLEQSRQVSDIVAPRSAGEISDGFTGFLKQEKILELKDKVDSILEHYRTKPGSVIPVLQQVQETIGFLPNVLQRYIAHGLNIAPSEVYGIVSFYSFFTMV